MAENPKIVTTDVRQLLQVGLVDARAMQGIYKLVRREGNLRCFRSSWRASEQEGTEKRIRGLVRMRKCDRVTGGRLPNFPPRGNRPDGGKRRRRVEVEQGHEQVNDELPSRDIAWPLVRVEESDELHEWSGAGAAKRKAPNLRSGQRLETPKELVQELVIVLFLAGNKGSETTTMQYYKNTSLTAIQLQVAR